MQQRMSAGQQALRIDVSDRAGGGDIHVAAHKHRADGGTGLEWLGLFLFTDGTGAHDRHDSGRSELRGELPDRFFRKSAEYQRSFDRLQVVGEILHGV